MTDNLPGLTSLLKRLSKPRKKKKASPFTRISISTCPICGVEFVNVHTSRLWRKYCGPECAKIAKRRQSGNCERIVRPGTTPRICLKCGKVFNSWGPGNRICFDCRHENYSYAQNNRVEEEGYWIA